MRFQPVLYLAVWLSLPNQPGLQERYRQCTTNVLLIESHALILSVLGRDRASQFLRDMEESNTVVIRARAADEERAKQILFQYTDKDFSFADAISFTVMERLGIRLAFTFDRDFAQYGLTALPQQRGGVT